MSLWQLTRTISLWLNRILSLYTSNQRVLSCSIPSNCARNWHLLRMSKTEETDGDRTGDRKPNQSTVKRTRIRTRSEQILTSPIASLTDWRKKRKAKKQTMYRWVFLPVIDFCFAKPMPFDIRWQYVRLPLGSGLTDSQVATWVS